jgi:hypothetical protein
MYHSRRPWVQVVGLPCALLDLRPLPTGTLEDLPRSIACLVANHRAVDPRDLGLSFEAPATTAGILASLFAGTSPDDHRHGSHPLLGFARFASLHRHTNHASTPRSRSSLRADGTTRFDSCSAHVVSHHLDGFLRATAAGLLHPATGPGIRHVAPCLLPECSRESHRRTDTDSRDAGLFPFKEFPPSAAVPRHRDKSRSPQPLPSCRYHSIPPRRPESSRRHQPHPRRGGSVHGLTLPTEAVQALPAAAGAVGEERSAACLADEAPVRRSGPPLRRPRPDNHRGGDQIASRARPEPANRYGTGCARGARPTSTPPTTTVASRRVQRLSGGEADFKAFLR